MSRMSQLLSSGGQPLPRLLVCLAIVLVTSQQVEARTIQIFAAPKRSATSDVGLSDYPDYQTGVRYDEYPLVVPKRAAMMLDKVLVALQNAMEGDKKQAPVNLVSDKMDLQRRGQQKGRVYWRCYFNAVTCFKRK